MDPTHYLASLTGYSNPGRLCLLTKKVDDSDEARQEQALLVHQYICDLYDASCATIATTYRKLQDSPASWFDDLNSVSEFVFSRIRDCCYPYVSVPEQSIFDVMARPAASTDAYGIRMPTIDHAVTIADPGVTGPYLRQEIYRLLSDGYSVEVGLSVLPIPVLFALEHCGVHDQPKPGLRTEAVQTFFPMPNLPEIEDSFVDGTYKRRNAVNFINNEYQLFYSRFWHQYRIYLSDYTQEAHWRNTFCEPMAEVFERYRSRLQKQPLLAAYRLPDRVRGLPEESRIPLRFPKRLGYFDALRCDYSFARIRHYTHTSPDYFQPYILFTNYAKYVRRFIQRAVSEIHLSPMDRPCTLVLPAGGRTNRLHGTVLNVDTVRELFTADQLNYIVAAAKHSAPQDQGAGEVGQAVDAIINRLVASEGQLPAYHFIQPSSDGARPRPDVSDHAYRERIFDHGPLPGVTLVNIGVGPSNARTITDHVAVLRPLCWIMVGHCGGLRNRQKLGDYVMANGYVRRDGVLDDEVPLDAPVHAARVINSALNQARRYREERRERRTLPNVNLDQILPTRAKDSDQELEARQAEVLLRMRGRMRVGPVISVSNRNWETSPTEETFELFERYRVVAVDMESAALAANAYRYRIAHGTFLCVSDRPLHGAIKMRLFADDFYRTQTNEHLDVALDAIKWLSIDFDSSIDLRHARELRGIDDPAWR